MTISRDAIDKRLALRERAKYFMSERLVSAINAELVNARSRYPETKGLTDRLQSQLRSIVNRCHTATAGETRDEFELWSACIVGMVLLARFVEEGENNIFGGLRDPVIESELDQLDKIARDNER